MSVERYVLNSFLKFIFIYLLIYLFILWSWWWNPELRAFRQVLCHRTTSQSLDYYFERILINSWFFNELFCTLHIYCVRNTNSHLGNFKCIQLLFFSVWQYPVILSTVYVVIDYYQRRALWTGLNPQHDRAGVFLWIKLQAHIFI